LPFALYITVGSLLAFKYHSWFGDAQARLANAYYVLYSRDPHFAAIGFVWNPGTSLAEIPVLLFKPIFPALSTETFGAVIVSAVAMAAAGYQIYRFAEELRLGPLMRWGLLAAFVANPMILYFGANGMSEPLFIFTLVATARYLAQWLREQTAKALVSSALALGLAYLVRNEAAAAAILGVVLVAGVTYLRSDGDGQRRRLAALTDAGIFLIPFTLAFVGWAGLSWVIVGHPFEQYSSAYGTASQLKLLNLNGGTKSGRFWWAFRAMLLMAPVVPLILPLALGRVRRERDITALAVTAILGGVVVFELAAYTLGQISWALRYLIYAIPLTVLLAACLAKPEPLHADGSSRRAPKWILVAGRREFVVRNVIGAVLALTLVFPCLVSSEYALLYSQFDKVDQQNLDFVFWPSSAAAKINPYRTNWMAVRREAQRLDALHLGHGAIMVDNFDYCIPNLILQSSHPKQFLIPNDEDYVQKMGAPYQSGVRYLLVPDPTVGAGSVNAINRQWPTMYADGAGIAELVGTIDMSGCLPFRLYRLAPTAA
jgi:hypothetical protein